MLDERDLLRRTQRAQALAGGLGSGTRTTWTRSRLPRRPARLLRRARRSTTTRCRWRSARGARRSARGTPAARGPARSDGTPPTGAPGASDGAAPRHPVPGIPAAGSCCDPSPERSRHRRGRRAGCGPLDVPPGSRRPAGRRSAPSRPRRRGPGVARIVVAIASSTSDSESGAVRRARRRRRADVRALHDQDVHVLRRLGDQPFEQRGLAAVAAQVTGVEHAATAGVDLERVGVERAVIHQVRRDRERADHQRNAVLEVHRRPQRRSRARRIVPPRRSPRRPSPAKTGTVGLTWSSSP